MNKNLTDEQKRALAIEKIAAINTKNEDQTSENLHSIDASSYYDSEDKSDDEEGDKGKKDGPKDPKEKEEEEKKQLERLIPEDELSFIQLAILELKHKHAKLKRTKTYRKCMVVVKEIKTTLCYKKSRRKYRGCRRSLKKAYKGPEIYIDSDPEQTAKDLEESEAEKHKIEDKS